MNALEELFQVMDWDDKNMTAASLGKRYAYLAPPAKKVFTHLCTRLTKADEIISMIDAAVSRDEIESVKSRALEYVREYKVES